MKRLRPGISPFDRCTPSDSLLRYGVRGTNRPAGRCETATQPLMAISMPSDGIQMTKSAPPSGRYGAAPSPKLRPAEVPRAAAARGLTGPAQGRSRSQSPAEYRSVKSELDRPPPPNAVRCGRAQLRRISIGICGINCRKSVEASGKGAGELNGGRRLSNFRCSLSPG